MSLSQGEKFVPPNRNGASDGEIPMATTATESSPPVTPRSLTFVQPSNPFGTPEPQQHDSYSFPEPTHTISASVSTSVSASYSDLPQGSSRPDSRSTHASTGQLWMNSSRPTSSSARLSSVRLREAFASPKTRPMTVYSTVQPSIAKIQRDRPKSTMLTDTSTLEKPWLTKRDPNHRIAYFITYAFMFFGIAAGAVRCFFGWQSVPILSGNLCLVLEEDFNSADGVFGPNGTFFQEVDMSGFGYVSSSFSFLLAVLSNFFYI